MATIPEVQLHIAGRGHIFYADVDTAPMDLATFVFGDEDTYGSWDWMGDTSSENLVTFSSEGGEATTKRTWDRENVRVIRASETISGSINSVNMSAETFALAFSGSQVASGGSIRVGTGSGAVQKALMVVMEDVTDIAGMYLPNVDLKGSFPVFSLEEFTEIPIALSVLGSLTQTVGGTPLAWEWFPPQAIGA